MIHRKTVSLVIPARNEEETIGFVLRDTQKTLENIKGYTFDVLVVDDGSTDKTGDIARRWNARVIENKGEHGKGRALNVGFKAAKGDLIIMLDADYSHRPEDIPLFLNALEDATLVIGSRHLGGSDEYEFVRGLGNYMLSAVFRILWGKKITDVLNGYKGFKKGVVKNYKYKSRNFEIELELVANALKEGGKIVEVPSHERARAGGKMKSQALREGWRFFWAIVKHGFEYRMEIKNGR